MKLQDLPSPYRELAEMRREQSKGSNYAKQWESEFNKTNALNFAFAWDDTPERGLFWMNVDEGKLPEIPASSLAELAEWQKSKGEKVEPTLIGGKTDTEWLYLFAGQAMQGVLSNRELQLACYQDNTINGTTGDTAIAFCAIKEAKALLTKLKEAI